MDLTFPALSICPYRVGDILQSFNAENPALTWPGTAWEAIRGKFLYAEDSNHAINSTGGAETVTLSIANLPAHTHGKKTLTGSGSLLNRWYSDNAWVASGSSGIVSWSATSNGEYVFPTGWNTAKSGRHPGEVTINATHEHASVGSGTAFNNMPPYITCYMWKRTA